MEPWIETSTGRHFWFTKEVEDEISILDIAHALSNVCRFTGHCRSFYSVAEHSVAVSRMLPKELAMEGLLHDASEAYLSDMASPVKQLLPDYKKLELFIMEKIASAFKLEKNFWKNPVIKQVDQNQLQLEAFSLLPSRGKDWFCYSEVLPRGILPVSYTPNLAKALFLKRFYGILHGEV